MEAKILDELLRWCSQRETSGTIMRDRFGSILSLFKERITFKIIKVAGTNGKGSTASMLSSCFEQEGINVGLFTSPHLVSINERFRVNGEKVELEEIIEVAEEVKTILYKFVAINGKKNIPSFFEILILIAIVIFNKKGVEIAIIEAGIGGDNDSTSVLPSIFSLLTSVGLDHKEQLGETLEEVALDKTGIANTGTTLIINSKIQNSIKAIIAKKALGENINLIESGSYIKNYSTDLYKSEGLVCIGDETFTLYPKLKGLFQKENINLVIEAWLYAREIGLSENIQSVNGMNNTNWEARFEVIEGSPEWLLDAAHNSQAFGALINAIEAVSIKKDRILIFGNSEEKDYKKILELIPSISDQIYIVDGFYKAINQRTLLENIDKEYILNIGNSKIDDVLKEVRTKHPNKLIVVAGSIFMVGNIRKYLIEGMRNKLT